MTDRPLTPRLLRLPDAARYSGVSPSTFLAMVEDGRMPPGGMLGERVRVWDVRALDAAIDAILYGSHEPRSEGAEAWA